MSDSAHQTSSHALRLKRLGIDTYQDPAIYMRSDCHVCRAEGFEAQSRVQVALNNPSIIATLNVASVASKGGFSEHRDPAARGGEADA